MLQSKETEIGRTRPTVAGFYIVLTTIRFDSGAMRIRATLFQDEARVRHLDFTTEIARDLWPLLQRAAELGKPARSTR